MTKTKVIVGSDGRVHKVPIENEEILKNLGIGYETEMQRSERLYREKRALIQSIEDATFQVNKQVLENKLANIKAELDRQIAAEKLQQASLKEPEIYLDIPDNVRRQKLRERR